MVAPTKGNRSQTPRKASATSTLSKKPIKPNQTILSFFKKAEKSEDSLFVGKANAVDHEDLYSADGVERYNEVDSPVKKRRLAGETVKEEDIPQGTDGLNGANGRRNGNGPFVIDSDSEDEDGHGEATNQPVSTTKEESHEERNIPPLKQEDTIDGLFEDLDEIDQDPDPDPDAEADEFEGEERRMRRIMQEQARLEAEEAGLPSDDFIDEPDDGTVSSCPICDASLVGVTADDAARHVNSCLDGDPIPIPEVKPKAEVQVDEPKVEEIESEAVSKRFARAAVPRPGQSNPFQVDKPTSKSAFSKLMSGNAEDVAWAAAADKERSSRGRPAYERTCPFYKIMPGFNICVDAFRYGAVKDCNAYFLSHFHSDHYIGLTAGWRHGPIYCSKVTGSLVKQQLGTAAKWVVRLEFDKPYDVPGTGATVTMIPANHCPGSSLFLFEKPEGKAPRTKRILHCGDFRACPEHVRHPLLKPDVVDPTGKLRQQKIDMCYLDTTYLNPRYSFPPQGDVIRATAELCASISPDPDCKDDIWEKSAKVAGTQAVSKFFKSVDDKADVSTTKKPKQRLLVICGTYSIGKERICVAIAQALGSKIFASPRKIKICKQLDDPELSALLTSDPLEAQVHMQMLMELRAETLQEYLNSFKPHFSRIVGFRPSGWNFRPGGKAVSATTQPGSVPTTQILHSTGWRTRFGHRDLIPQRGSTKEAMCFGVPYSEHSSFRELALFVMSLRIERVIPTVNVGSEVGRKRMRGWTDRWMAERRKGGIVRPLVEGEGEGEEVGEESLWDGKNGTGGGAWW